MKTIYLVDFDGTITTLDTLDTISEKFALPTWREIDEKWVKKEISTIEAMQNILTIMDFKKHELIEFLNVFEIDPYFISFMKIIKEKKDLLVIVSDGWDYNINSILNKYNIRELEIYANKFYFNENNEIKLEFPYHKEDCHNGTCKCKILEEVRTKYPESKIVFVGDGYSDVCVAPKADLIFAKDNLAKYCEKERIEYIPFSTFKDIIEIIKDS